ncbi:MAG TPA: peptidoglycan editing factor PgeF [Thermodesulfobacteriota bacterium]|nr:peptidoglycan editing factor PgeF [Thermodesulfobacteriota bacterium]
MCWSGYDRKKGNELSTKMNVLKRSDMKVENGFSYFEAPRITHLEWLRHAFLTRKGGMSPLPFDSLNLGKCNGDSEAHVMTNKKLIASAFSFDPDRLILLRQVHQDRILILKEPHSPIPSDLEYDALITNSPNRFLGIKTADCLPILVTDPVKKVIAAIHAGRQGTGLRITGQVLKRMKVEFSCLPEDLLVALGPSIGPCCYEIDGKVFLPEWEPFSAPRREDKWMVDLPGINIAQIKEEGIREDQIFWISLCTHCNSDLFFSYRREGQTGRQLSFIGKKA